MFRVIKEIKPTWCDIENVIGIINMELEQTLSDMESERYETQTFIIPACSVNATHRRDRVWVVAYSYSNGLPRINQTPRGKTKKNGRVLTLREYVAKKALLKNSTKTVYPNPVIVEEMMGFPTEWTELRR